MSPHQTRPIEATGNTRLYSRTDVKWLRLALWLESLLQPWRTKFCRRKRVSAHDWRPGLSLIILQSEWRAAAVEDCIQECLRALSAVAEPVEIIAVVSGGDARRVSSAGTIPVRCVCGGGAFPGQVRTALHAARFDWVYLLNAWRIFGSRIRAHAAPIREVPWRYVGQKYYPAAWDRRDRRPIILVVTPYAAFPPTHGGAYRIHGLLKHIAKEYQIILLSDEAQSYGRASEAWFASFRAVHLVGGRREPATGEPVRIARMRSHSHRVLGDELARLVRVYRPDLVHIEYVELALEAPEPGRLERYSWPNLAERQMEIYRSIIHERTGQHE